MNPVPQTSLPTRVQRPATPDPLRTAARRLASIHDGIRGQIIPSEVMDFYKAIKGGDSFRPRMTRVVVLGIEEAHQRRV